MQTPLTPPTPVQGRRGLLASAVPLTPPTGRQWEQLGLVWNPHSCEVVGPIPYGCAAAAGGGDTKDVAGGATNVVALPFGLLGAYECSLLDRAGDVGDRARANLAATEGWQIERELWTGEVQSADGDPGEGVWLARDSATDLGTAGVIGALATLEQQLGECLHGQRGVIHATRQTVTAWQSVHLLVEAGDLLLTALDTIVVAGAGYTGSAPDGTPPADIAAAAHAYGTGLVYLARGPVSEVGEESGQIDRQLNTRTTFVERAAAVMTAGCCHLAIEVDHTNLTGAP